MKFLGKHSVLVSQTMKFVLQKSVMRKSYVTKFTIRECNPAIDFKVTIIYFMKILNLVLGEVTSPLRRFTLSFEVDKVQPVNQINLIAEVLCDEYQVQDVDDSITVYIGFEVGVTESRRNESEV